MSSSIRLTQDEVLKALKKIYDPEIGVNIVEAGFVRDVRIDDKGIVEVDLMLTTPFCPLAHLIIGQIRTAILSLAGVKDVIVRVVGYGIPPELERLLRRRLERRSAERE
ncbi:MAG: aromatic ring hydroxylase [Thermoprotei archaeon]|nr:MAG: aromatic ring hydroxylase [Thermoprotei archaeon]RLF25175.1 MAG: aromatic ring hydroxylase [Thermoprotei archaeon]